MNTPFVKSPLGGLLGTRTVSFYRLDPTGTVPIEPLGDLVPPLGSDRVTFDMIDSEDGEQSYSVTLNPLQDFTSATSNIHREPKRRTFSGTLIGGVDVALVGAFGLAGAPGLGGGMRNDLRKLEVLEAMAERREPVMVVSPRKSFAKAWIEMIGDSWTPELGPNSMVSVSIVEARIVSPLAAGAVVPDVAASLTGNNRKASVGSQSTTSVETSQLQTSTTPGVAPSLGVPFA